MSDAVSVYKDLKAHAREVRAYWNEIRQFAWIIANYQTPGCWSFWRHGFASRFGRRVERSGYTAIPRYDTIAQEVAWHFPEFDTEDGTERLWEFLLSPYDRLPSRDELWSEALEISRESEVSCESPF